MAKRKPIYCPDTQETAKTYTKYLLTQHWQNIRKQKLELNPICEKCGSSQKLNIHHQSYRGLGKEKINNLITLCEKCHSKLHQDLKNLRRLTRKTKRESYLIGNKVYKLTPYRLILLLNKFKQKGIYVKPIKLQRSSNFYQETSPLISLKCKLGMGQLPTTKPKRSYLVFK